MLCISFQVSMFYFSLPLELDARTLTGVLKITHMINKKTKHETKGMWLALQEALS